MRVPTLVLHARNDDVVPLASGKILAAEIPGAEFVELDSANHVLLADEPAWQRFCDAVLDFTGGAGISSGVAAGSARSSAGVSTAAGDASPVSAFASLSPREREVLELITEGLANAEIAGRLGISAKTVRNHVSNLFDKLGVWTRAQAIVFARDRGFPPKGAT